MTIHAFHAAVLSSYRQKQLTVIVYSGHHQTVLSVREINLKACAPVNLDT